ncbi:hypothetical protein U1Q18_028373 [Sarracenia purpurea var. burkii]
MTRLVGVSPWIDNEAPLYAILAASDRFSPPTTSAGELWAAPLLSAFLLLDTVVCSSALGFLLVLNSFQVLRPPEAPPLRIIVNGENNHQIRSNSDRSEPINSNNSDLGPKKTTGGAPKLLDLDASDSLYSCRKLLCF